MGIKQISKNSNKHATPKSKKSNQKSRSNSPQPQSTPIHQTQPNLSTTKQRLRNESSESSHKISLFKYIYSEISGCTNEQSNLANSNYSSIFAEKYQRVLTFFKLPYHLEKFIFYGMIVI